MPQSISHTTTIPDSWAPVSNTTRTLPLRLTKRPPTLPRASEDHPTRVVNGQANGVSNSNGSVPQRPPRNDSPASFYDPNDPAFSSDPYHHPDHGGPSLASGASKGGVEPGSPVSKCSSQSDAEPPPSYDDSVPAVSPTGYLGRAHHEDETAISPVTDNSGEEVRGASHVRGRAHTSYSPASSPYSNSHNLPSSQQSPQDEQGDQDELLAYLSDDRDVSDRTAARDVPMSLRPHRGLPVAAQPPPETQSRPRPVPDNAGLLRSTTMPSSASRSVSEPLARTNTERPHIPHRGNTTINAGAPHRGPAELDRIDELDETLGISLHHRGPYDMRGKVDTPPPRVIPVERQPRVRFSIICKTLAHENDAGSTSSQATRTHRYNST